MRKELLLLSALALVGHGLLAEAVPSQASVQPSLSGPHVVHWSHSATLEAVSFDLLHGLDSGNGNCEFAKTTGAVVNIHLISREVAYDPDNCLLVMETGAWTSRTQYSDVATPLELSNQATVTSTESSIGPTSTSAFQAVYPIGTTPPVGGSSTLFNNQAWGHQWYQDPIGIHVAEANSAMMYTVDPQCVYTAGIPGIATPEYHADGFYEWFAASGWIGPTAVSSQVTAQWSCPGDDVRLSNLVFLNDTFCNIPVPFLPPVIIRVQVNINREEISESPSVPPAQTPVHATTFSLTGWPCSLLLNYQQEVGVDSLWTQWTQDQSEECLTFIPPDPQFYDLPGWHCYPLK